MKAYDIMRWKPVAAVKNDGDAKEWAVCGFKGITRVKHDNKPFDKDSDVNIGNEHISVKANKFSLLSGKMCDGLTTFDEIWNFYESKCHSNKWAYVTADYMLYEMDITEFRAFIYEFGYLAKESEKNGGYAKIRCKAESKKMIRWLEERRNN